MARRASRPPVLAAERVRPGQGVRVHVNLHNGLIAVADPSTRNVLGYAHDITLAGVTFRVPPGGLAATRKAKCRRVFAYATGQVLSIDAHPDLAGRAKVSFDPFTDDTFMCGGQPIRAAAEVTFADKAGWLPGPARGDEPGEGLAAAVVSPGQVPEGAYVLHGGKRWQAGLPQPGEHGSWLAAAAPPVGPARRGDPGLLDARRPGQPRRRSGHLPRLLARAGPRPGRGGAQPAHRARRPVFLPGQRRRPAPPRGGGVTARRHRSPGSDDGQLDLGLDQRGLDIAAIHHGTGIYTMPPEIDALLDRLGWPWQGTRLLDPGAGNGGFLVAALRRLDLARTTSGKPPGASGGTSSTTAPPPMPAVPSAITSCSAAGRMRRPGRPRWRSWRNATSCCLPCRWGRTT